MSAGLYNDNGKMYMILVWYFERYKRRMPWTFKAYPYFRSINATNFTIFPDRSDLYLYRFASELPRLVKVLSLCIMKLVVINEHNENNEHRNLTTFVHAFQPFLAGIWYTSSFWFLVFIRFTLKLALVLNWPC